jgi:hypothetical protein
MFHERVVEPGINEEISELGVVDPMNENSEIPRYMIALCLFGACWIQV